MEDQMDNSSYLSKMPELVIRKILSYVLNLSNVSRTCKTLYKIVCEIEKRKRVVLSIKLVATTENSTHIITIDDDVVYDSIMDSLRTITELRLDLGFYHSSPVELNEGQLGRIAAIMKRFGIDITSLMLSGVLSINDIIGLLNLAPELEALKFQNGIATGTATKRLHLPKIKMLEIELYRGLSGIVNLIPAGSLNYYSGYEISEEAETLKTVLTRQPDIKCLTFIGDCVSEPILRCVNHLQLDKLKLVPFGTNINDQLVEILKCQTNLTELRLSFPMDTSAFEWICNNLKKLEVFEVHVRHVYGRIPNGFVMLRELTKLRYLSTNFIDWRNASVQFEINLLERLKIVIDDWWHSYEDFNEKVFSMARIFTNLTDLDIPLEDFHQFRIVLSQCTKLIRLRSFIEKPDLQQLAENETRFPNIRQLAISTHNESDWKSSFDMSQGINIIRIIIRAMPNLRSLSMPRTTITFNVEAVKDLIREKNSLEDLYVNYFKLHDDLSTSDNFVSTVRCLSDNLKTYRLRFFSLYGNSSTIRDILSNEFKVRDDRNNLSGFYLFKGDLTKFDD